MSGFSWFSLIDCRVVLPQFEDKQSLAREDYNVPFFYKKVITED